ncbi:MAG: hypothetical protein AAFY65_10875 [Pseudomonadota bacterium]
MIKDDGVRMVVETVAAMRGLDIAKLTSIYRAQPYARVRQEIMFLCMDLEVVPQKVLALELERDHGTIRQGREVVRQLMRRNDAYAAEIERLRDMCLRRLRGDRLGIQDIAVTRVEAMRVAQKVLTCTNPHMHVTASELRGMAAALMGVTETTKLGGHNA